MMVGSTHVDFIARSINRFHFLLNAPDTQHYCLTIQNLVSWMMDTNIHVAEHDGKAINLKQGSDSTSPGERWQ